MTNFNFPNEFAPLPARPIHPAMILEMDRDGRGNTMLEYSQNTGIPLTVLQALIEGREPITPAAACILEQCLQIPAEDWLKLQLQYEWHTALFRMKKAIQSCDLPTDEKNTLLAKVI